MTPKKRKKAAPPGGTLVYCGPTIPGVAKQFTFYRDGIPPNLETATNGDPALAALVIPLEKLPDAMRQLRERTGSIYTLYCRAGRGKNQ